MTPQNINKFFIIPNSKFGMLHKDQCPFNYMDFHMIWCFSTKLFQYFISKCSNLVLDNVIVNSIEEQAFTCALSACRGSTCA